MNATERPEDPAVTNLSEEDRSKDEMFVRLAHVAEDMVAKHGKDFAMGGLILAARFIAEGRPLTKPQGSGSDWMKATNRALKT